GGLPALAWRVLDDQVLAGRPAGGPAGHLQVLADTVLLVHHEVTRLELQRVDPAAAPARHPPHVLGGPRPGPVPGQVTLGEHRQLECRPDETLGNPRGSDVRDTRL